MVILHSHVSFSGFKVRDALGEGVLAAGVNGTIRDISIQHNAVLHNDLGGGVPPASPYFECQAQGPEPGDCGEGVHLLAVAHSKIRGNLISRNSGGVLLTDETGPTDHNLIEGNIVTRNASDCGITVPGHNPHALNAAGKPQPSVAGVYDNVIAHNIVTANGLKGDGAGVLFANASAGTASYNNLVTGNYIAGNGLSGVTMHAHTVGPGQFEDLSGNKIIGNVIGKNNIDGDTLDSPASPEGPADNRGAGVLRRHAGQRHDRPQPDIPQRDRDLAQQAGHRAWPAKQHVPPCGEAHLRRQLAASQAVKDRPPDHSGRGPRWLACMTAAAMGNSFPGTDHGPRCGAATAKLGGILVKSKGSKPARWSGILVMAAALAALALSAGRVARIRRSGKRSG